ncbi:MAG: dockerin type I domain-containing protein [Candidatus Zixiibacteriota bacterium]
MHSHSNSGEIGVEFYSDNDDGRVARDNAYDHYINDLGYDPSYIEKRHTESGFLISLRAAGIRHWCTHLGEALVYAKGCYSSGLNDDWNSLTALGYDQTISGLAGADVFWERMDGIRDRGPDNEHRSVSDARQGISALVAGGNEDVVLSPIVLGHAPGDYEMVVNNQAGFIEFDCSMNTSIPANQVIDIMSSIGSLENIHWTGDHRIDFTVNGLESFASVDFRVYANKAVSQHNGAQLDGNTNPAGTNGVGPNADFFNWTSLTSYHAMMDFENGADGAPIQSNIPGMHFTTTQGYDWIYGDKRTGNYNIYPYNEATYWCDGNFFAWLGPNQGLGRIDFEGATATSVSMQTSNAYGLHLEAYDKNNNLLDNDYAGGNLNTNTLAQLKVTGAEIDHVLVHNSGNYWLIDNLMVVDLLQETLILLPENYAVLLMDIYTTFPGAVEIFLVWIDEIADKIQVIIDWLGSEMKLALYDPNGNLYFESQSTEPPIILEVIDPMPGQWTIEVTAVDVPYDNYPFSLVAGTENAPSIDCFIESTDLMFQPAAPILGQNVTILTDVHNSVLSTYVDYIRACCYRGNPDDGGIMICEDNAINLEPGASDTVYFQFSTAGIENGEEFYVRIDPGNNIEEYNEANNVASVTISLSEVMSAKVGIYPDVLYALYAYTITPKPGTLLVGNFPPGFSSFDINEASILINETIAPLSVSILDSHPDFENDVMELVFPVGELVHGYGVLWDTTVQYYNVSAEVGSESHLYAEGTITIIGHKRGDVDHNDIINLNDIIRILSYIYNEGQILGPIEVADVNCDGTINILDIIFLINYLYRNGPSPICSEN